MKARIIAAIFVLAYLVWAGQVLFNLFNDLFGR